MSDLIDRQAAIKAIKEIRESIYVADLEGSSASGQINHHKQMEELLRRCDILQKALETFPPSAQPEIIRCKDCKHFNDGDCTELPKIVSEMDYCSYGERKEA